MLGPLGISWVMLAFAQAPPPIVDYDLEVRVEPTERRLHGAGTIRWTNRTQSPADRLCFHLYLNAFAGPGSTFMKGLERAGDAPDLGPGDLGFIEMESLRRRDGDLDLLPGARPIAPDDGNPEDQTVLEVPLDRRVEPGETIELSLSFVSQLPKPVARAGAVGGFMMAAQWFPKLGVFEARPGAEVGGWRCHQYHALGEFHADFGRYRVGIEVPAGHEVAASGRRTETSRAGARVRHVHEQDRIHDFAFAVDPWAERIERRFALEAQVDASRRHAAAARLGVAEGELRQGDVTVILMIRPERAFAVERYFRAAFHALTELSLRFGPYPYPTLTIVDPPRGAQKTAGMEYPTLVTAGARFGVPADMPVPESVTLHEIAHQWFYGMLGSDEVNEAWLDEGLTSYATLRAYEAAYGETLRYAPSLLGMPLTPWFVHPLRFRDVERARFLAAPDVDPSLQPSFMFRDLLSYRTGVYARPVLFLLRLESLLGAERLDRALFRYVKRHRFGSPTSADLLKALEEEHGASLPGWVTEPLFRAGALDLRITELQSRPSPAASEVRFRTSVVVERRGELMRPVELRVTLEDGSVLEHPIEGPQRWWRFEHLGSRAKKAELFGPSNDPLNGSEIGRGRRLEPSARPGLVFAGHAAYVLGLALDLLGALL